MTNICLNPQYLPEQRIWADCGHCRACRLKLRSTWAERIKDELQYTNHKMLYITLTYAPWAIPRDYGLSKPDLQKFFKRVRNALVRGHYLVTDRKTGVVTRKKHALPNTKFRYYACGEYGDTRTKRPHYHAVIMGLDIRYAELLFDVWGKCEPQSYKCEQTVSEKAMRYVCGYTAKKLGKNYNEKFRKRNDNRQPPFQIQSVGIGRRYIQQLPLVDGKFIMRDGKKRIPCRYYRKCRQLDGEIYRDVIGEFQDSIVEEVKTAYKGVVHVLYDCKKYVQGRYNYGRYVVSDAFFKCLRKIRIQCDDLLADREFEWREKINIIQGCV